MTVGHSSTFLSIQLEDLVTVSLTTSSGVGEHILNSKSWKTSFEDGFYLGRRIFHGQLASSNNLQLSLRNACISGVGGYKTQSGSVLLLREDDGESCYSRLTTPPLGCPNPEQNTFGSPLTSSLVPNLRLIKATAAICQDFSSTKLLQLPGCDFRLVIHSALITY